MNKILFAVASAVLLVMAATAGAEENNLGGITIQTTFTTQTTFSYTDENWSDSSSTSDCSGAGWGDDVWEFTNSAFGFLTVTVGDCCVIGDYYEIWIDGVLKGTTPNPGYPGGSTLSVGSVKVWLAPGTHTIEIRDALDFSLYPGMCPAGYTVSGEWEAVLEFTKEIDATTEGGDTDGVLETGEKWTWDLLVTITNISGETIHIGKVHDRVGGDLESDWKWYYGPLGPLDRYTRGNTEKVFYDFEGDFDLADGASVYFVIWVSPDENTGKGTGNNSDKNSGNNNKDGKQEYTSPGEHCLNSGAWLEAWIDGQYIEANTDPVCVDVVEAD
jgi:hypothetical protein